MSLLHLLAVFMTGLSLIKGSDQCNEKCTVCKDGRCRECRYGWYGHNCKSPCHNCWTSGCYKHSGKCVQCKPGMYMEYCETPCPDKCRADRKGEVYCRRKDGNCLDGCKDGWWGDICNHACNHYCESGTCLQASGDCLDDCSAGRWGHSCENECSQGCRHNRCLWLSGICMDGCNDGYYGVLCDKKCSTGCFDNLCDWKRDGQCTMGCKLGYAGGFCNKKCDSGCVKCQRFIKECEICRLSLYGNACEKKCNINCKGNKCNMQGLCMNGCIDGFRGRTCNNLCPANCLTCYQEAAVDACIRCKTGWTGKKCQIARDNTGVRLGSGCTWKTALMCVTLLSALT